MEVRGLGSSVKGTCSSECAMPVDRIASGPSALRESLGDCLEVHGSFIWIY